MIPSNRSAGKDYPLIPHAEKVGWHSGIGCRNGKSSGNIIFLLWGKREQWVTFKRNRKCSQLLFTRVVPPVIQISH